MKALIFSILFLLSLNVPAATVLTANRTIAGRVVYADFQDTNAVKLPAAFAEYYANNLSYNADRTVSTWTDLGSGAHDLTQGTNANCPIVTNNVLNGLNAVRFDGTNDRIISAAFPTSFFTVTIVGVIDYRDRNVAGQVMGTDVDTSTPTFRLSANQWQVYAGGPNITGIANANTTIGPVIFCAQFLNGTNRLAVTGFTSAEAVSDPTVFPTCHGWNSLKLGGLIGGYAPVDIYHIRLWTNGLTTNEMIQAMSEETATYGVTAPTL